jgi:hypothetical protein
MSYLSLGFDIRREFGKRHILSRFSAAKTIGRLIWEGIVSAVSAALREEKMVSRKDAEAAEEE